MFYRLMSRINLFVMFAVVFAVVTQAGTTQVTTWGRNTWGQLGDGTTTERRVPGQLSNMTKVVSIACGYRQTLVVKSDGTVWDWGYNGDGDLGDGTTNQRPSPIQVSGLTNITAVSSGDSHSVALRSDGTVWAWGYNGNGQLGNGTHTNSLTPVQVSGLSNIKAIACGYYHTLALRSDGSIWAWGANNYGQLGDSSTADRSTPVHISLATGLDATRQIACGGLHSLAVRSDGNVFAWGNNAAGQLGDGTITNRSTPVRTISLGDAKSVAGGATHSLAIAQDGTVFAWGAGASGQLGDGTTNERHAPILVSSLAGAVSIAGGGSHSMVLLSDGSVRAWGYNGEGELGDGTTTSRTSPVRATGLVGAAKIACGYYHSVAVIANSPAVATGLGYYGALGDGTYFDHYSPKHVNTLSDVTAISASRHSLAIRSDGSVWAWGNNESGQIGDGTTTDRYSPIEVGLNNVIAISAAPYHSLALRANGTVWSWGSNAYGQLGDGTTTDRYTPAQVAGLSGIIAIHSSEYHSLALMYDGSVWAWGTNYYGGLGDGTFTDRTTPVRVYGLSDVIAISGGYLFSVAVRANGTVWAWGYNGYGQLGTGTTDYYQPLPVQAVGMSNVTAISTGSIHCVALQSDGTAWSWGDNYYSELGDGTNTDRFSAVQVVGLAGITAIASGAYHNLVIGQAGSVSAWGHNSSGQLGDETTTDRNTPTQIVALNDVTTIAGGMWHTLATKPNLAPVAFAGPNQTVTVPHDGSPAANTASFTLYGGTSTDADGDTLTYEWKDGAMVVGSTATLNLSRPAGTYTFNLKVTDPFGGSSTDDVVITVNPEPNQPPVAVDQSVVTPQGASINVTLIANDDDNDSLFYSVVNSPAHGQITILANGQIKYQPDSGYIGADSFTFKANDGYIDSNIGIVSVTVRDPSTVIIVPDVSGSVGGTVTLSATLKGADGVPLSGKSIVIQVDSVEVAGSPFTTDDAGNVSTTYPIEEGSAGPQPHTITATFAGDSGSRTSTGTGKLTVSKSPTTITVANVTGISGQTVNLSATLIRNTDLGGIADATLTFKIGAISIGSASTDPSGVATISYRIPSSMTTNQTITVSFTGDSDYNSTSGTGSLGIRKASKLTLAAAPTSPKIGATVTATATLKSGNILITGATVHFLLDGVELAGSPVTTASTGKAAITFKAPEHAGNHQVTATFNDNGVYVFASATVTIASLQAPTKLTGETKSAQAATNISLGAVLTRTTDSSSLAGKSVTFTLGASTLTGTTDSSGRAAVTVKAPAKGKTDKYTVKFAGDADYSTSSGTASIKGS